MKKHILLIITVGFIFCNANSQITKGNWMVGGNGSIKYQTQTNDPALINVKALYINLAPNIGYFFIDKFAAGLRTSLGYSELKYNGPTGKQTSIAVGPFFRYYFLNAENKINVFAESAYQYSFIASGGNGGGTGALTFSAGPVIYFNSSVGIEITANYGIYNYDETSTKVRTLSLGIGFQIHLEKDK